MKNETSQPVSNEILTLALFAKKTNIEAAEQLAKERNVAFTREDAVEGIRFLFNDEEADIAENLWLDKNLDESYEKFKHNMHAFILQRYQDEEASTVDNQKISASKRLKKLLDECTHSVQRTIEELLNPTANIAAGAFRGSTAERDKPCIEPSLFIDDEGVTIALNLHSNEFTMPQDRESVVVVINDEEITDFEFDAQEKSVDLFISNEDGTILLDKSQQFEVRYREDMGKIIILL